MIKCALCGGEWVPQEGKYLYHENNSCPLGDHDDVPAHLVVSINKAIEETRKHPKDGTECRHYDYCEKGVFTWPEKAPAEFKNGVGDICPCSAWREE